MISLTDFLFLLVFFISTAFLYVAWKNNYFARRSIKLSTRPVAIFGHMYKIFRNEEHFVDCLKRVYLASRGQRYTGLLVYINPIIVVRDLDLIKKMTIKDFDHFVDHKVFMDEEAEPLFGSNLFFLRGQKWRDMRAALSPAFTGSKMKGMFPLILECTHQFRDHLMTEINENEIKEFEVKELMTRFTNDVIASTAFGFKINSFADESNEFYAMGKKATNFSGWQFFKFHLYATVPSIMKKLNISLFPRDVKTFYRKLVKRMIQLRESDGIVRHDMIHLLMLAKKGSLVYDIDPSNADDGRFLSVQGAMTNQEVVRREWTDDDLTAQAVAFIIAGFGTPSSMLCFLAYELARNPEVQDRLYAEIYDVYKATDGTPTFGELQNMKYIDMVISETLRLWPPDGFLERVCVKPYNLPPQNENSNQHYQVNLDDEFIIPIYSLHHDPEYFPDPEKFDPERFSDENKANIKPFSYIPFGAGPRLCIGARFALMEAKAVLFHILSHFEFIVTQKTQIPFVLAKDTFNMHPVNGLWLGIKRRKNPL